jgi:hypothetical protein
VGCRVLTVSVLRRVWNTPAFTTPSSPLCLAALILISILHLCKHIRKCIPTTCVLGCGGSLLLRAARTSHEGEDDAQLTREQASCSSGASEAVNMPGLHQPSPATGMRRSAAMLLLAAVTLALIEGSAGQTIVSAPACPSPRGEKTFLLKSLRLLLCSFSLFNHHVCEREEERVDFGPRKRSWDVLWLCHACVRQVCGSAHAVTVACVCCAAMCDVDVHTNPCNECLLCMCACALVCVGVNKVRRRCLTCVHAHACMHTCCNMHTSRGIDDACAPVSVKNNTWICACAHACVRACEGGLLTMPTWHVHVCIRAPSRGRAHVRVERFFCMCNLCMYMCEI